MHRPVLLAALGFFFSAPLLAQTPPAPQAAAPAPVIRVDPTLDAATALIGRALFLRCFCADNNLVFDAAGHTTSAKTTDWTLAAADIKTVERKSPTELELTGVRVAIRYAADRHEWERHPQADEKLRILISGPALADPGNAHALEQALHRIFAQGIDLPLQRAMPPYWQHFFNPQLPWLDAAGKPDSLATTPMFLPTAPGAADPVTSPVATHKTEPAYTPAAQHDRVKGTLAVRLVVDAAGAPQRIAVLTPLGYGLDAATVAAVERYRFTAGTRAGQPAAVAAQVTQEFILVTPPR